MPKRINLILMFVMFFSLFSCGENLDFKEIDREMENLEWRIDRLKSVIENMKGSDIIENRKTFQWSVDEFEKMYDRLDNEINDIRSSENDDMYSSSEIIDAGKIISDLSNNANQLINKVDEVMKGLDITGQKEMKEVTSKFRGEASKFVHELDRLNSAVSKLKSDKKETEADDTVKSDSTAAKPANPDKESSDKPDDAGKDKQE